MNTTESFVQTNGKCSFSSLFVA